MTIRRLLLMLMGVLLIGLLGFGPAFGLAQPGNLCPELVTQALAALGDNCGGLGRNSACYGYNNIGATFTQTEAVDFFSQPSDTALVNQLQSIQTAPLNTETGEWGIAVLNVQANIPETIPGQGVVFVLFGDVEVENAVAAGDTVAETPVTPVEVTALVASNLRSGPSTNTNVIGNAPLGAIMSADRLSADGEWLRVVYEGEVAWISRWLVESEAELATLPVLTDTVRSPMQAFRFSTSLGSPDCTEAPSLLVVQGPENVRVQLEANGADIVLGSTIVLRLVAGPTGPVLNLAVVDGSVRVGGVVVPGGFQISAPLNDDGTIGGDWVDFLPLTEDDLILFRTLERIPRILLNYPIVVPDMADIQALLQTFNQQAGGGVALPGAGGANCSGFKLTSPLDGLPAHGDVTYFWDPAPEATKYRVDVFNQNGVQVGSTETVGNVTNLTTSVDAFGDGNFFTVQVIALVNGQPTCATTPVTLPREARGPSAPPTAVPVCGNRICEPGETFPPCPECRGQ